MSKTTRSINEIRRIRYQMYRDLGYTPKEAQAMRGRVVDISHIKVDRSTGKIKKGRVYKEQLKTVDVVNYEKEYRNLIKTNADGKVDSSRSVYQGWGYRTQDRRVRDYTANYVKKIQNDMGINNEQAYFMLYYMTENNIPYKRAKVDMMVNKEFELYAKARGQVKNRRKRK